MQSSWIKNLVLLILVVAIAFFVLNNQEADKETTTRFPVSDLKLSSFEEVKIFFPSRTQTSFKLTNLGWRMVKPFDARADELYVYRILALLATTSPVKLEPQELDKYGLDNPVLRIVFSNESQKEEFLFGTYNAVTEDQYMLFQNNIFLVSGGFSETASFVAEELIDKKSIATFERIKSYDYSRLEQWQEIRLKFNHSNGQWTTNSEKISFNQNEMDEWFDLTWRKPEAIAVEPYKMDARIGYKSFDMTLEDGKKITFYRIQEHPELKLYRSDEKLLYRYPSDLGFTMLNPNIAIPEE
tara:strand:+ start:12916 stop:13809 length:894 start_codon:yes stop_codon:yes gene_type:complete